MRSEWLQMNSCAVKYISTYDEAGAEPGGAFAFQNFNQNIQNYKGFILFLYLGIEILLS